MALIQDQPEDLASTNALDDIEDPDEPTRGERAEIYLSGAHICTLDNAPRGLDRVTLMVEIEVVEESKRFNENGDAVIPIRRCRRIGDMWIPGTQRPPTKEEIQAQQLAAKTKAAAEQAERDEAERAEQEKNEPPMFDEDGTPVSADAPRPPDDNVVDAEVVDDDDYMEGDGDDQIRAKFAEAEDESNVVQFSDGTKK